MSIDSKQVWDLISEGNATLALEALKGNEDTFQMGNHAIALLMLHRLEEALADYRKLCVAYPDNDGVRKSLGVVLWWLARPLQAVETWRNALDTRYTDAAGGVEVPALLFFAASQLSDKSLEQEALSLLRKRWKPGLAKAWPGPIAGLLLGKLDRDTFLSHQTFLQPILEARRMCKAHFWAGVLAWQDGDQDGYFRHLRNAIEDDRPEHRAVILEPEFWLATAELERRAT